MAIADGDIRRSQLVPICRIFRGLIRRILRHFKGWPELEEVYRQFRNPDSDGEGRWVDLRPYHPNLLPSLNESRMVGDLHHYPFHKPYPSRGLGV